MNLAILISGNGTTAEAILSAIESKKLTGITPVVVISSQAQADGIEKAQRFGIPTSIVDRKNFTTQEEFGIALLSVLQNYQVTLISQNGWLPLTPKNIVVAYRNRIINQHPGPLDPGRSDFGGKNMFGARVVAARIAYSWITQKDYWTESTIHYVNEEFDKGSIIQTMRVDIEKPEKEITLSSLQNDPFLLVKATHALQDKLLPIEHKNVITVIQSFVDNKIPLFEREKPLITSDTYDILDKVKELAVSIFPKG